MARKYNNNRRFRKRRRRPTNYMNNVQKGLYMAGTALSIARGVKSLVNSEKKVHDKTVSSSTIGNTGTFVELSGVPSGDDYTNREGRSILAKSIELNGWAQIHASATASVLRIIIFMDHSVDPTDPTLVGDLLKSASTFSLRESGPLSMKRYTILQDKLIFLTQDSNKQRPYSYYKKLNHHIKFSNTTADTSAGNSIWALMISNEGTNEPSFNCYSRMRFYDN